jgi:peptidoglycan/LPS O-acetylase OafA/YrhL
MSPEGAAATRLAYRPDIDGLRAVAIASVVVFHAFPQALPGGFTGVDVFFVISGYLITRLLLHDLLARQFSLWDFYGRRARRILPALFVVLAATFGLGWLLLLPGEFEQLGKHIASGAFFVSNYVLRAEAGYFDAPADLKPLLHLWSLAIEEQFYIIWPLLLALFWGSRSRTRAVGYIVLLASLSVLLSAERTARDPVSAFFATEVRAWELLSGAALAWVCSRAQAGEAAVRPSMVAVLAARNANVVSLFGLALLIVGFVVISKDHRFPGTWAAIPVAGTVMLIAAGPHAWVNRCLLSSRGAVGLGLISYSLYLWHWPILAFARILEGDTLAVSTRVLLLMLAVVLAWLTYRHVERPARLPGAPLRVAAFVIGVFTVGAAGAITFAEGGLDSRPSVRGFVRSDPARDHLLRDEACLRYAGETAASLPYCRFSDAKADQTLAVIGDSHAFAAFSGLAALARSTGENVVLLANSSCPTLIDVPIFSRSVAEQVACAERTGKIIQILREREDIRQVFIFTRRPIYLTGTEPLSGHADALRAAPVAADVFLDGLQNAVNELRTAGKNVIYVTENPELRLNPSACVPRPFRARRACAPTRGEVVTRQREYLDIVRQLKGATVAWSLEAFCPAEHCLVVDPQERLLYADDDHLSIIGSQFQADRVLSQLLHTAHSNLVPQDRAGGR